MLSEQDRAALRLINALMPGGERNMIPSFDGRTRYGKAQAHCIRMGWLGEARGTLRAVTAWAWTMKGWQAAKEALSDEG